MAGQSTDDKTARALHAGSLRLKTHTQNFCPLQQLMQESSTASRYTYIASLVTTYGGKDFASALEKCNTHDEVTRTVSCLVTKLCATKTYFLTDPPTSFKTFELYSLRILDQNF